ncbi:MAG: hypothetical protein OXB84_03695 [Halobacteriovoraceae bacterium]|nr:hypothetical protein [Halobacteriovoraceae bacterium]
MRSLLPLIFFLSFIVKSYGARECERAFEQLPNLGNGHPRHGPEQKNSLQIQGNTSWIFEELSLYSVLDEGRNFIIELSIKLNLSNSRLKRYYRPIFHPEKQYHAIGFVKMKEDTIILKLNRDDLYGLNSNNSIVILFDQGKISLLNSQDGKNQQIGLLVNIDDPQRLFGDLLLNDPENSAQNRTILDKINHGPEGYYEFHGNFSTNGTKKEEGELSIYFDKANHATVSAGSMRIAINLKGGKIKNRIKNLFK